MGDPAMNILLAADLYPPVVGGTEQHVADLAAGLRARGHEVTVVTAPHPDAPPDETTGGIRVVRPAAWVHRLRSGAPPDRRFHPTVADPGLVRALDRLVDRIRPDVVHAHGWIAFSALRPARRAAVPMVLSLHDYAFSCARRSMLLDSGATCAGPQARRCLPCAADHYGLLAGPTIDLGLRVSRPGLRRVDRVVANSRAVAAAAESVGVGRGSITVIAPVTDAQLRRPEPGRPPQVPPEGDFLLFAGSLGRHKGLDVLLEAAARLRRPVPVVVLGSGLDDPPPSPAGVDVRLHRNVAHADVRRAQATCTVAVVPSRYPEPFGLVAVEAMSAGAPVVAAGIGGLTEVIDHDRTGLLVTPDDPITLARTLDELLADPARRARLADAGRASVRGLDCVARLEALYTELLARPVSRVGPVPPPPNG